MVEAKISKKEKEIKPHEHYLLGIHQIMRKYGAYKLNDVLDLYITEFYSLIKLISYEITKELEAHEAAKKKSKRRRN